MLALVDPLVFRLSSRHEGGRRLFIIEIGMDIGLVFPPNIVSRPNISIVSNSGVQGVNSSVRIVDTQTVTVRVTFT